MGGRGQFSHAFSGEVYDFYSVNLEYFGYTPVRGCIQNIPDAVKIINLTTKRV
jgi:hypothetical protein